MHRAYNYRMTGNLANFLRVAKFQNICCTCAIIQTAQLAYQYCTCISVEQAALWGGSNLLPSLSRATKEIGSIPG